MGLKTSLPLETDYAFHCRDSPSRSEAMHIMVSTELSLVVKKCVNSSLFIGENLSKPLLAYFPSS